MQYNLIYRSLCGPILKIRFILSKKNHNDDDNDIDYFSYDLSDEIINNIKKIYNDDIDLI